MTKTKHDEPEDPGYNPDERFNPIVFRLATNEWRDPVGSKRQVFRVGFEHGWRAAIRYMSDNASADVTKNLASYGPIGRDRSGPAFDELVQLGTPGIADDGDEYDPQVPTAKKLV